ncbi:MAG: sigma 54-interacting transcriptional regulator [Pseudomonadota bacterium]
MLQHSQQHRWSRRSLLIFAVTALIVGEVGAADSRSLRFQRLSRDDGLSQSFVYSIAQDRTGYMWFGTQEGLNRFDGHDFLVFANRADQPNSISDESIRTVIEDRDGTIWIGTDAGGLSKYDPAQQSFTNYLHDPNDPHSIPDNRVRVLLQDREGFLWVGTDGSGLARFDPRTERFERLPHRADDRNSLSGDYVWSIAQRSDGTLWVGTKSGLSRLNADGRSFTNFRHNPSDPTGLSDSWVRAIYETDDGTFWVGTDGGGLNRLDPETGGFDRFQHAPENPRSLSHNCVQTILQDSAGVLWIGTVHGLNAWSPDDASFDRYFHDHNDRFSLSHDSVLSMFEDRAQVLWVGTVNGLSRWNQATRAIHHYRADNENAHSLSGDAVTAFAEAPNGDIWVGTFGGGLDRLNRGSGQFDNTQHDPADSVSLSSNHVMSLLVDRNGTLWAGTRAHGLNRLPRNGSAFARYRHNPQDAGSISADGITAILEHSDGSLWFGTFGGGLNRYDRDSDSFAHYRHDEADDKTLSSDRVLVLFEDSDGSIWIGTYGSGLNRLDPMTGLITRYRADASRPDALGGDEIFMIQEDPVKNLWVAVKGEGLYRWSYENRQAGNPSFERFTELDGLPSLTIYSGQWDSSEHLWLSTAHGLTQLDPVTLHFRNYSRGHGLQGDEFNLAAGFRAADGELFFGGINGFNAFYPDRIASNALPPRPAVTRFLSMNSRQNIASGETIELDHEQRIVRFEYAALDYAAPSNNRFRYRLVGLDDEWVDAGNDRQVTYTNLPPGDYAFNLHAMNNDGVWSVHPATVGFSMRPAPWRTTWAYLSYALCLSLISFLAIRARNKRRAVERHYTQNLEQVQTRLSEAQRIGSIANWEWDISADSLWWSEEAKRLFGVSSTASRGYAHLLDHVHPGDRDRFEAAVTKSLRNGSSMSLDHRVADVGEQARIVHQRAEVAFDEHGAPTRMAGTVNDISERKQAEDDIRRRAGFQHLLAELSYELIRAQSGDSEQPLARGLKLVAKRYDLDEVTVQWPIEVKSGGIHRWMRDVNSDHEFVVGVAKFPWVYGQIVDGKSVILENVSDVPDEAKTDRDTCLEQNRESLVVLPLFVDDTLTGTMAFASRERPWPDQAVDELRLIADTLANAIARAQAVAEIRKLQRQLQEENLFLREEVRLAHGFPEIVGENAELKSCLRAVEKVAPTDVPVLILGETGTGKELIARAVYQLSRRSKGPLISVNCPALPANLIESELFGHEKGAFTGALQQRKGRFELANGGTLFLDEIGDLPLELQAKLLRVLQTGQFERLGGSDTLFSDVRLIAATNRNLRSAVDRGEFRSDLLYRIQTFPIKLPPLRDRREDISILTKHFVQKHADRLGKKFDTISARLLMELESYDWPGNVRELESVVERMIISTESGAPLRLATPLGSMLATPGDAQPPAPGKDATFSTFERSHILQVLEQTNWKISGSDGASTVLGIPASTLRSKMKRHGIQRSG